MERRGTADGIWISDSLIGSESKEELLSSALILEDTTERDWDAGSKNHVLDLVLSSVLSSFDDTLNADLKGRQLQVVVQLANIILRPWNPEYNGG